MSRDAAMILAETQPAEMSVAICLKGKLSAEYARLEDELRSTAPAAMSLAGPGPETTALLERLGQLEAEILDWRETFTFRALPPLEFSNFQARVPDSTGMDDELFRAAYHGWVCELAAACLVEPVFTAGELDQLSTRLSVGDWLRLRTAATNVNTAGQDVPFSAAASALSRSSGVRLKQPEPSGSPVPASLAESPSNEPSSNATTPAGSLAG